MTPSVAGANVIPKQSERSVITRAVFTVIVPAAVVHVTIAAAQAGKRTGNQADHMNITI
jgi:hypothetical protein